MLWLKLTAVELLVATIFAPATVSTGDGGGILTTVSVVVAAIAIVVAGGFTIRAHVASTWRDEAEAEKKRADRFEVLIHEERQEQQHVRHELKEEVATLKGQLQVVQAKTDLSAHEAAAVQRNEATLGVLRAIQESLEALARSLNTQPER